MNPSSKALASVSLNLDNKWTYLKLHGDPSWRWLPTYFDVLIPRVLSFLRERKLRITVFLTGQDAAMPEHRDLIRSLVADGHEIGNYSFHNEPGLASYLPADLQADIARAEEQIADTAGYHPVGFRSPGFTISHEILSAIAERGYLYDSSTLPRYFSMAARTFRLRAAALAPDYRKPGNGLVWGWPDARRPVNPYLWQLGPSELLEIPVATALGLRTPMHSGYALSFPRPSGSLALPYVRTAIWLCSAAGRQPSVLLNALDFISADTAPELASVPSMKMPIGEKLELLGKLVDLWRSKYTLATLREQALELSKRTDLVHIEPQYLWKEGP